ncbi:MAG: DUF4350 domain-containing protein [Clostridiales bacterium]|jgi:hypothetical protein|nr:DUF4350 domain-containing protein [Clostridiales bacterium]
MVKKGLAALIIAALLALLIFLIIQISDSGSNQPEYTIFNTRAHGASAFYDTLEYLGFPVDLSFFKLTENETIQHTQIILAPDSAYYNSDDLDSIMAWVAKGGRLIFLDSGFFSDIDYYLAEDYDTPMELVGGFILYKFQLGEILSGNVESVVNQNLKEDTSRAEVVAAVISAWGAEKVLFNEYYHGFQQNPTLWKVLPPVVKLAAWQLILAAAAVIWALGKRFGKPVPYYEETEREENEYLVALSRLYLKTGTGDATIGSFFNRFIRESAKFFRCPVSQTNKNIVELWRASEVPDEGLLLETLKAKGDFSLKSKAGRAKFLRQIANLQKLTEHVRRIYNER